MPKLVFAGGSGAARTFEIARDKTTVGRGSHNDLCIPDPSLSREHCEILVFGPEVIVRDLGSRNGTFVDGLRLTGQQCQLKHGHTVTFGAVPARLEIDHPASDSRESSAALDRIARLPVVPPPVEAAGTPSLSDSPGQAEQTLCLNRASNPSTESQPATAPLDAPPPIPAPVRYLLLVLLLLALLLILLS